MTGEPRPHPDFEPLDLGWVCGSCWHSSSDEGQPRSFGEHRCSGAVAWTPVLEAIVLGLVAFAIAFVVFR